MSGRTASTRSSRISSRHWGPSVRRVVHPLRQQRGGGLRWHGDRQGVPRRRSSARWWAIATSPFTGGCNPRILPSARPCCRFSIAEDELRKLPLKDMVGDYAAWDYFQSIDRPENRAFIQKFKATVRPRSRHQRRDRGGVQQRPPMGASRRRGRDRPSRRRDQGAPAAELERTGGDRVGGRGDSAHLAAGLHWADPRRRPVRPGLELGEAGTSDSLSSVSRLAVGMGIVSERSVPRLGRWANPGKGGSDA